MALSIKFSRVRDLRPRVYEHDSPDAIYLHSLRDTVKTDTLMRAPSLQMNGRVFGCREITAPHISETSNRRVFCRCAFLFLINPSLKACLTLILSLGIIMDLFQQATRNVGNCTIANILLFAVS